MAERGGRRNANEMAPYGRAIRLFANQQAWENQPFDEDQALLLDRDEDFAASAVYTWLERDGGFETFTNLNLPQIMDVWRLLDSRMNQERHRGPVPLTSTMDHLLLFMMWLKSGETYAEIAAVTRISPTRLEDALNRVRGPLAEVLQEKWWQRRIRPVYRANSIVPTAGLIIDGHTTQINIPKLPFEEGKRLFDGKNHIYGYKNEVAVQSVKPFYCLFVSPHYPGSVHDYEIHKQQYHNYGNYLLMTNDEVISCGWHQDPTIGKSWGIKDTSVLHLTPNLFKEYAPLVIRSLKAN